MSLLYEYKEHIGESILEASTMKKLPASYSNKGCWHDSFRFLTRIKE